MDVRISVPGAHMAMNAAQAWAAGVELGAEPKAAATALEKVQLPAGRVKLEKYGEGWLLDDSYNANPDSLLAGLQTLEDLPGKGRNVALLGAMAELGTFCEMLHEESGVAVGRRKIGICFVVGEGGKFLIEGAQRVRPGDWVRWFSKKEDLLQAYREIEQTGDRILVKGSRRERMETVAAQIRGAK
jgi:UDP-N-acetylmuramoyl-tripeptide--D-alanyl-D-alanine ligase